MVHRLSQDAPPSSHFKVIPKYFAQRQENSVKAPGMRQSAERIQTIHPNLVSCRQVTAGARNVRVAFVNLKNVDIYKTVLLERRSQVNIYQRDLTIELLNIDQCCYVRSLAYKRDDIIIR